MRPSDFEITDRMRNTVPLLLLFLIAAPAFGQINKWIDEQGQVHYSDQPPPPALRKQSEQLDIKNRPAGAPSAQPKSTAEKELDFRKRQAEATQDQAKKDKEAADAKAKQENCDKARSNLRSLQDGGKSYSVNAQGERVYLDDKGREEAIRDAQKEIDNWCSK